ncbi:M20/M25/M40 family metallo-hydrolase [Pedobacter gandavensis]|uniref:M28 family metallopeptidase n=1 Tax=Pedobacter gandavensis TaxID=2679963 RepID=UPI00247A34A0|nr:M20/M25/M40 family metallo-hydrolase [Pedobacter gandavensis]WGQ08065.1 M20/M25/M40 family metallo-hydrolase [Pedobacter gandavensis]
MRKFTLTALAISLSISLFAQEKLDLPAIQKIRQEGLENSKVMDIAFQITDVAGPRLSNSPGLKRAQDWAVQQFTSWGLKNVQLEAWGQFGKGWQIDKYYAATTLPYYHAIIGAPKAWTPGTKGPIKSEVILLKADTVTDLAPYKGKLAGKIVLFDQITLQPLAPSYQPDVIRHSDSTLSKMAAADLQGQGQRSPRAGAANNMMAQMMKMRATRAAMASFLKDEQVGMILTYARGSYGTFFTSNGASYALDAPAVSPELEISSEDYLHILRLLRAGQKVEIEADIKTSFYDQDPNGYNVIAEIPGTDRKLKEEVVMIGGHYDSWHSATGATDNAAGAAVMMEAMRILKTINFKPKRTIRIALWSSEEQGLHGSRGYVAKHFGDPKTMTLTKDQKKISAYYNLDNGTGAIRGIYAQGNTAAAPIFQEWLNPFQDLGAKTVTLNNTGGTDHLAFDALGIPGFQFIQDPMDYNTRTHHSNQDTFDRLAEEDLKRAATIVASFVYHTAQRDAQIPRKELPKAPEAAKN